MIYNVRMPISDDVVSKFVVGDVVNISGILYVMRDAAHKRIYSMILNRKMLPINFNGQVIYYAGPCPSRDGDVIGSIGPTTSGRMDVYTPELIKLGLRGMIGKGDRSNEVVEYIKKYRAVYFAAVGGTGALISRCVRSQRILAFEELGTEAIRELAVENFRTIVAIDCKGNNFYRILI